MSYRAGNKIPLRQLPGTRRLLFPLNDIQAWEEAHCSK